MDFSTWKVEPMTTEKKMEANRRNALNSTGPKTDEGKAVSSRNAIKHGLTAETLVHDEENADDLDALIDSWNADLKPRTIAEKALVGRAAVSCWRLKRCVRAERAQQSMTMRHAGEQFDLEQLSRAYELGRTMLNDPINRCIVPRDDKDTKEALAAWNRVEPSVVVKELESFAQGVTWLLDRYRELGTILETEGFWHYPEKYLAIRMLGKRPEDALRDREIAKIFMACRALHPQNWDPTADFQQAAFGVKGRPIYGVRVDFLETFESMTSDQAFDHLKSMIRSRMADLDNLKRDKLDELNTIDREFVIETSIFEKNKTLELAVRYETAREREVSRSINLFLKLRKFEVDDSSDAVSTTAPKPTSKPRTKPASTEERMKEASPAESKPAESKPASAAERIRGASPAESKPASTEERMKEASPAESKPATAAERIRGVSPAETSFRFVKSPNPSPEAKAEAKQNLKKGDLEVAPRISKRSHRENPLELIKQARKSTIELGQEFRAGSHSEPTRDKLKSPQDQNDRGAGYFETEPK